MANMLDTDFDDEGDDKLLIPDPKDNDPSGDNPSDKDEFTVDLPEPKAEPKAEKKAEDKEVRGEVEVTTAEEDELKDYSQRVKDRVKREVTKFHNERRAREESEKRLNELAEFSKRIIAENNQLKGLVEGGEKVLVTEHQARLDSQMERQKTLLREAIEAADPVGQANAQAEIGKIAAAMDRLSTHRVNPIPRTSDDEFKRYTQPVQQPQVVQPDEAATRWKEKNRWFGRDEVMTAFAMGLHQQLVTREGIMPNDADYYKRIDTELRKRFAERFQDGDAESNPPRRTTNVGTASRTGGKTSRRVTLTPTQAQLARRLGLTMEQYAEQLVAENGAKEWTHGR